MIVIGIILLLVGGGVASFLSFNDRQKLVTGAKDLQEYLRTAQRLVRIGEKPTGCERLTAYKVTSQTVGAVKEIKILAVCLNAGVSEDIERNSYSLPKNISLSNDIDVTFLGLRGGVVGASTIEVVGDSQVYTFEVTQGGEITQGELL